MWIRTYIMTVKSTILLTFLGLKNELNFEVNNESLFKLKLKA